jgi:hypothetical protein
MMRPVSSRSGAAGADAHLSGSAGRLPAGEEDAEQQRDHRSAANAAGFSLHAGLDIEPRQREKLERLCRCVRR